MYCHKEGTTKNQLNWFTSPSEWVLKQANRVVSQDYSNWVAPHALFSKTIWTFSSVKTDIALLCLIFSSKEKCMNVCIIMLSPLKNLQIRQNKESPGAVGFYFIAYWWPQSHSLKEAVLSKGRIQTQDHIFHFACFSEWYYIRNLQHPSYFMPIVFKI